MPIYDYQCTDCGHRAEVLRKLSDPVLTTCPACGQEGFAKQLSAAGFQLKGSGWYATDFKGGSSTSNTPAATAAAPAAATETPAAGCGAGACGHTHH
ncbi:zinc ribbon domain-containing protein [Chitinimonas arctica]|uniref:Zinc ribbon domain-containing protein n=1 Tax=Chitinimonas arctica TaxID=2594795 RepID=A0A516SA11_9NEIS|nr:zinc ribbon domain-containing protein [Chitinimonas arctica]QDQ24888.1 zinc ribbon domain-containing protein [Chitinimonas arctica]